MKKILLGIAILSLSFSAQAQVSAGKMMVGGSANFFNTSAPSSSGNSSQVILTPSFGYFVKDRLAVGMQVTYNNYSQQNSPTNTAWSFAPFVRYYKFTSSDKFAFFCQASVGYTPAFGSNPSSTTYDLSPGFVYFFTPRWGFDFMLPGLDLTTDGKTNSVSFITSLTPAFFGFRYYFGK